MSEPSIKKCTICHKPMDQKFRPFCSARCANIDLGRWLNESYAIPAEPLEDKDDPEAEMTALDEQ